MIFKTLKNIFFKVSTFVFKRVASEFNINDEIFENRPLDGSLDPNEHKQQIMCYRCNHLAVMDPPYSKIFPAPKKNQIFQQIFPTANLLGEFKTKQNYVLLRLREEPLVAVLTSAKKVKEN